MPSIAKRLSFYRACYQADSRELQLDDVSTFKAERWGWLDGREELASGAMPFAALSAELGEHLLQQQNLYQRELQLIYGVLPVCGRRSDAEGKAVRHCAPLVYFEARLESLGEGAPPSLAIDLAQPQLNRRLLRQLLKADAEQGLESLPLPSGALDDHYLADLMAWLQRFTVVGEVLPATAFPALEDAAPLKKAMAAQRLSLRSAALVALAERGAGSRGILHELQLLQGAERHSPALRQLLGEDAGAEAGGEENVPLGTPSRPEALPASLSLAQRQALANATRYPLSFVAGPPGTGKSYTLAALALDRHLQGESVLLVSRSQQAVTVIADKLRDDLGLRDGVLQVEEQSLLRTLRARLDQLLQGELPPLEEGAVARQQRALKDLLDEEAALSRAFDKRSRQALRWSGLLVRAERGTLAFWQRWLQVPWVERRVRGSVRHWQILDDLRDCQRRREAHSRQYIDSLRVERLQRLLDSDRQTFVRYNQAIRARSSQRQQSLFDELDPARLLAAFPIWVVSLDDLHKVLPLREGLFDVLVIDEATQCDIASALPALQRCKRAVVAGDSRQLRHVSFLSRAQERQLLQRAELPESDLQAWSYRDNSLLDLVGERLASQRALTFLDEHFRGRPALIRFSNEAFYNGRIRVMKERPEQVAAESLSLHRLEGQRVPAGHNPVEAERALALLEEHVGRYRDSQIKPSVGLLSPFRDQVEYLRRLLAERLPGELLSQFRVRVATPYGFQGEERDLMILSFAIDAAGAQAAHYLNREDMFNVAITRAREHQMLLFSGDERQLAPGHLLRRYLERLEQGQGHDNGGQAVDAFQQQVAEALQGQGVRVWSGYPVAGHCLDLFCQRGERVLAIDLIGYPGASEDVFDLERYQVLARAGLEMIPLSYAVWKLQPQVALEALLMRL
ncbi:hypothetical protein HNP29_000354 [Pseudomonas alcaligenes]|nr:hypothetical protein [Pseudomonas alcaligenes]